MAVEKVKEVLNGKYDGVIPATLLPPGSVSDGLNMRKVSSGGGWKVRKGATLHNTTAAESGAAIRSLHHYENPRSNDYHFIAQCNGKLLDCTTDPPTKGTTLGTTLGVTAHSTTPGFSCVVREDMFYADGTSRPIAYGGDTPYCTGCMVWDDSQSAFVDYTRKVTDARSDTYAYLGETSNDEFYVCSSEIADGMKFTIGSASTQTATMAIYAWQSGAWTSVGAVTDGTADTGKTMAVTGTMTWTRDSADEMKVIGGIMGYWYKFVPSAALYSSAGSYVSACADTQLLNDDGSDYTDGWTDADGGDGASSDGAGGFAGSIKLDGGTAADANFAYLHQDIGTFTNRVVFTIKLYHDLIGTRANDDGFNLMVNRTGVRLNANFSTAGLEIYDGAAWTEVGTDLVSQDAWQTWTFDLRWWDVTNAVCDVYLDDEKVGTDIDCSETGAFTEGHIQLYQRGDNTANTITYIDWIKVSPEFAVETLESDAAEIDDNFATLAANQYGWLQDWRSAASGDISFTTFDSRTSAKFDSNAVDSAGSVNCQMFCGLAPYTRMTAGSIYDGRVVITLTTYFDDLGDIDNGDYFQFLFSAGDGASDTIQLAVAFSTDGLEVYDGAAYQLQGAWVAEDVWREWTFDFNIFDETVDIYRDNVLMAAQTDCSSAVGWPTDNSVHLRCYTNTVAQQTYYIDKFAVGPGFTQDTVPGELTSGTAVTFSAAQVTRDATTMTNKWSGVYQWVAGCRHYYQSDKEYREVLGKISNESTSQYLDLSSAGTSDYVYIKTIEPATGFGFGIVDQYGNTNSAKVDLIEYWDGEQWATVGSLDDITLDSTDVSSFSQTGTIFWDGSALSPRKRIFEGDNTPGYWYRVSWAAALSNNTRVAMVLYAPFPEILPAYGGCVEFKSRLFLWGDPEYPNRLRYSAGDRPDCFSGSDSNYTDPFGDQKKILLALKFYNELIVFKEDSVWLLEGYSPQTFGVLKIADTVGLASTKTAHVVEVGFPTMHADEPLSVAIWQDVDGIYVLDGRKPRKASLPVDQFFNPEYSDCIAATNIRSRQALIDPLNNEYHFLLPTSELVYNYVTDEWYPPWERNVDLITGLNFKGTDDRYYTYGADAAGFVWRLENDTTDKSAADADVAISHSIKSRAISATHKDSASFVMLLREIQAELKARSAGTITTKVYKDLASSGTTEAVPETMSMVNAGYSLVVPELDLSTEECLCFQVEFLLATVDQEIEIWSFNYEREVEGDRTQAR